MSGPSLYMVPGAPNLALGGPDRDAKIDALEAAIRADLAPAQVEIVHHYAPGIYAREMRAAAGSVLVSKVHNFENLSVLSKGRMALYLADGTVREVCAGFHVVAPPGERRVAVVLDDVVWTCFHNTDERDPERIEAIFISQSRDEFLALGRKESVCLG